MSKKWSMLNYCCPVNWKRKSLILKQFGKIALQQVIELTVEVQTWSDNYPFFWNRLSGLF